MFGLTDFKRSVGFFLFFNIVAVILNVYKVSHPLLGLNLYTFLEREGYNVENHTIQTKDGYLLTVQRIPCGKNEIGCSKKRPVVYFMHGMTTSSIFWILSGSNRSLPLLLADRGYDIWLGNNRGNMFARSHIELDPDTDPDFWNFSYHEMAFYDVPATINYILNLTEKEKLTYVGYSQGSTQLFVLGSEKSEYNNNILLACLLSPVTNMYNITNVSMGLLYNFYTVFNWMCDTLGIYKILEPNSAFVQTWQYIGFSNKWLYKLLMEELTLKYFLGASDNAISERTPFCCSHWPDAVSINQLRHYMQGAKTGIFGKYNYGHAKNMDLYNHSNAPVYDLSKISMPVAVWYSYNDSFVNTRVMEETLAKMPNVVTTHPIATDNFDHFDFMFSNNVTELLFTPVIKIIDDFHSYNKNTDFNVV